MIAHFGVEILSIKEEIGFVISFQAKYRASSFTIVKSFLFHSSFYLFALRFHGGEYTTLILPASYGAAEIVHFVLPHKGEKTALQAWKFLDSYLITVVIYSSISVNPPVKL